MALGKAQTPVPEKIFENDFEINRDEMHMQILAGYDEKIKDLQFLRVKSKAEARKELALRRLPVYLNCWESREEVLQIVYEMQMKIIKKYLDSKPR